MLKDELSNYTNKDLLNSLICYLYQKNHESYQDNLRFLEYFIKHEVNFADDKIKGIFDSLSSEDLFNLFESCLYENTCSKEDHDLFVIENKIKNIALEKLNIKRTDRVLDLGSGEGLLLREIISSCTPFTVLGVEKDLEKYVISKLYLDLLNTINYQSNVILLNQDFNDEISEGFDKVIAYPYLYDKSKYHFNYLKGNDDYRDFLKAIIKLHKENSNLRSVIVVPYRFLRTTEEEELKNELIGNHLLEEIVEIPNGYFENFNISISILVLTSNNQNCKFNRYRILEKESNKKYSEIELDYKLLPSLSSLTWFTAHHEKNLRTSLENFNICRLEEMASIKLGSQYTEKKLVELKNNSGDSYKVLKPSNISEDGLIDYDELEYASYPTDNFEKFATNGDVIITSKTSNIKIAVIDNLKEGEQILISSAMFIIRPLKNKLNPYYLAFYLRSNPGQLELQNAMTGDTIKSLSISAVKNLNIIDIPLRNQSIQSLDYEMALRSLRRYKRLEKERQNNIKKLLKNSFKVSAKEQN